MKAPGEKRKSKTTTRMTPKAGKGDTGIDLERTPARGIRAECPNPACRKVHVVDSRLAGRKGRCPCGALIPIPAVGAAAVAGRRTDGVRLLTRYQSVRPRKPT